MKKHIKRLLLTTTILLALIGVTGLTAYAAGYIQWGGTQDYGLTLQHLDVTQDGIVKLKETRDGLIIERSQLQDDLRGAGQSNEQLENIIRNKDNEIDSLEQEIVALEKRVADGQTTRDQIGQAEKDMSHVEERSREVMGELND